LLSANGQALDPTPSLDAVIEIMSNLPASFSVIIERKFAEDVAATAASAATGVTDSSSSSNNGNNNDNSPSQAKKNTFFHENFAAAPMNSGNSSSKQSQEQPGESMVEKVKSSPKCSSPISRITGGNQAEVQTARRSLQPGVGAPGSDCSASNDCHSDGGGDGEPSEEFFEKPAKKAKNGSAVSPSKVGSRNPSRLSDGREARKRAASFEIAPTMSDSDENLVELSLLDDVDDDDAQPGTRKPAELLGAPSEGNDFFNNTDLGVNDISGDGYIDRANKLLTPLPWATVGAATANDTEVHPALDSPFIYIVFLHDAPM